MRASEERLFNQRPAHMRYANLRESHTDHHCDSATLVDLTSHSLPNRDGRTWGEFFQDTSRKAWLATAMMGSVLGLTGFGGADQKRAEAGIVISLDPLADQRARDNGFGYSVEGGGNVGFLRVTSPTGPVYASVVWLDAFTAITSAHGVDGSSESYAFGTTANYNNGTPFSAANIFIHPGYGGAAGQGIDLAVIKVNIPVLVSSNIVLANGTPALNDTLWFAGYGVTGNRDVGYTGQDGFIRAGTSAARLTPPLLGGSPEFYQNALFRDLLSNPTGLRPAPGDSGGGVFTSDGRLTGIMIGGNVDITGSSSMFLNLSPPAVSDFVNSHMTAVPEPSSLTLFGGLSAATVAYRLLRRNRRD